MILSDKTIRSEISNSRIFKLNYGDKPLKILGYKDFNIKSSSVDLTVGRIYEPSDKNVRSHSDLQNLATEDINLESGDTLLIEVDERFNLASDLAGIVFPPNRLSKEGVLMTNPGHIDPGYKGLITVCLVNMGKKSVRLKKGDVIARLLLFRLDKVSDEYTGSEVVSVSPGHLDKLSKDFAGINTRLPVAINKLLSKQFVVLLALLAALIGILALAVPEFSKSRIEMLTHSSITKELIVPVKTDYSSKIEALSDVLINDYSAKIESVSKELDREIILMKKELQELKAQNADLKRELGMRAKKEVSATND